MNLTTLLAGKQGADEDLGQVPMVEIGTAMMRRSWNPFIAVLSSDAE